MTPVFFSGIKELNVAGAMNFLPWLRFIPFYKNPLSWIKVGQAESHEEYKRLGDLTLNNDDDEGVNMTRDYLKSREEKEPKEREKFFW